MSQSIPGDERKRPDNMRADKGSMGGASMLALAERLELAGRVAGQIAHDFNNLLTPLLAYPDLIRHEIPRNETVEEYLATIEKASAEMQCLTQQLLALARRGKPGAELFCINDVITQAIRVLSETLPAGIKVKCALANDLPAIAGSSAQMQGVLEKLCQNAVEAMGESGSLTLKSETLSLDAPRGMVVAGDYVKVSLLDTGSGIPEDIREKIFDPFFTTKRATRQRGSGLGLSIVHGIVRDHRGFVEVESAVGQGTTFSLYLPVAHECPSQEPAKGVAQAKSGDAPESRPVPRILIADDEQMIRKLFGMIIASEFPDAMIDQAKNGKEAVEMFSRNCHDLIIMDLQMPGQDGRESFFEIQAICGRKNWTHPAIVFCTGFTPSESLTEIIRDNSRHCLLRKPVKADLLLETVRARLRN